MRPELALILTAAALAVLGLALLPGGMQGTRSNDEASASLKQSLAEARAALAAKPPALPVSAPQIGKATATRALFPAAGISALPPSEPEAPAAPLPKLLLRGIVSVDSAPRAIFGVEDQSAPYRTVGTGDTIDAYTVETIGEDSVTLRTVDGQTEIFQLRGTGELPRY
jgi:hypothetical protein